MSKDEQISALTTALELMWDKWENGDSCYECPEELEGYIGKAFDLSETEQAQILSLIPATCSTVLAAVPPAQTDEPCACTNGCHASTGWCDKHDAPPPQSDDAALLKGHGDLADQIASAIANQGIPDDEIVIARIIREKLAEPSDTALMEWLDDYVKTGCADFGFEMDGGIFLRLQSPGDENPTDYREHNGVRDAIRAAMRGSGEASNG